jgi:hypothetical protein
MPDNYDIDYEEGEGYRSWTDPITGERVVEYDIAEGDL